MTYHWWKGAQKHVYQVECVAPLIMPVHFACLLCVPWLCCKSRLAFSLSSQHSPFFNFKGCILQSGWCAFFCASTNSSTYPFFFFSSLLINWHSQRLLDTVCIPPIAFFCLLMVFSIQQLFYHMLPPLSVKWVRTVLSVLLV